MRTRYTKMFRTSRNIWTEANAYSSGETARSESSIRSWNFNILIIISIFVKYSGRSNYAFADSQFFQCTAISLERALSLCDGFMWRTREISPLHVLSLFSEWVCEIMGSRRMMIDWETSRRERVGRREVRENTRTPFLVLFVSLQCQYSQCALRKWIPIELVDSY